MNHVKGYPMERLTNPLTPEYKQLKELVLGSDFAWFYDKNEKDNFHFYSHVFLDRPEFKKYSVPKSPHIELFSHVLEQIFECNNLSASLVYRMNANAVDPQPLAPSHTISHVDHDFPHMNMLIYLPDAGGETVANVAEYHEPIEDDIVIFSGYHYHKLPETQRRVVLVATYGHTQDWR